MLQSFLQWSGKVFHYGMSVQPRPEMLANVPAAVRGRILSGMRWTVWLSAFGVPFTYGTMVVLARIGPEAIGAYGLLGIYISLVSCLLYFGGDAVVIKFVPELASERRVAFLVSYFFLICLGLLPWIAVAGVWPSVLKVLYGTTANSKAYFVLLCLSPIYIVFSLVSAALKGSLEIRWAQTVLRLIPIGSFIVYTLFFLFARRLFSAYYTELIWSTFLSLCTLGIIVGLLRLQMLPGWSCNLRTLRFSLPDGFWRFMIATEQVSALNFLIQRMDYILIVNAAGVVVLGRYVAILSTGTIVLVVSGFFLDSLLPSLTNLFATSDYRAAEEVVSTQMRMVFLADAVLATGLSLLAGLVTIALGPKYTSLKIPIVVMVTLVGLASPGAVGGILLSSIGRPQRAAWVSAGQLACYVLLFWALWPRFQLLGATLAYGLALVIGSVSYVVVASLSFPVPREIKRGYATYSVVLLVAAAVALEFQPLGPVFGLIAWAGMIVLFLLAGRYTFGECRQLSRFLVPERVAAGLRALL